MTAISVREYTNPNEDHCRGTILKRKVIGKQCCSYFGLVGFFVLFVWGCWVFFGYARRVKISRNKPAKAVKYNP